MSFDRPIIPTEYPYSDVMKAISIFSSMGVLANPTSA